MSSPFITIITGNSQLDRIQANIANAFNSQNGPFVGGNLLSAQKIGTGATVINHGLNRTPQLWIICDQDTLTTVKRTAWDNNSITLEAASACTISIWVN